MEQNTDFVNIYDDFDVAISRANKMLINGDVVALPTETVYGLVCDIYNELAINKIYILKGRDYSKPLSAFCYSIDHVISITEDLPEVFYELHEKFLPGPLALVVNKKQIIPKIATSNFNTIAIRIPDNDFLLELLKSFEHPLASTSANYSNSLSAINALQVWDSFQGKIPLILDGGQCKFGIESTILDISNSEIKLLREGAIKIETIEKELGRKVIGNSYND